MCNSNGIAWESLYFGISTPQGISESDMRYMVKTITGLYLGSANHLPWFKSKLSQNPKDKLVTVIGKSINDEVKMTAKDVIVFKTLGYVSGILCDSLLRLSNGKVGNITTPDAEKALSADFESCYYMVLQLLLKVHESEEGDHLKWRIGCNRPNLGEGETLLNEIVEKGIRTLVPQQRLTTSATVVQDAQALYQELLEIKADGVLQEVMGGKEWAITSPLYTERQLLSIGQSYTQHLERVTAVNSATSDMARLLVCGYAILGLLVDVTFTALILFKHKGSQIVSGVEMPSEEAAIKDIVFNVACSGWQAL